MTKVLVTGVTGFIGRALSKALVSSGHDVIGTVRSASRLHRLQHGVQPVMIGDIGPDTEWNNVLHGVKIIFHLATWTPRLSSMSVNNNEVNHYTRVNVKGTEQLARSAVKAGIKRIVFASSIMVYGRSLQYGQINDRTIAHPTDKYGKSKLEAEKILMHLCASSDIEISIIRIPLVYGASVHGHLVRLLYVCSLPIPLPLANAHNKRSMIYLSNLVDALIKCSVHPKASGKIYLIRDGKDLSAHEMVSLLRAAMIKSPLLFSIPNYILLLLGRMLTKHLSEVLSFSRLSVDDSRIRSELGWTPPFLVEEAVENIVLWYKQNKK